ncbi:MAG TPA: nucleotidyltransferase domain-containing protein [Ktedonobacterales bacterium]|jgi:predicted nucleotidyltransferase|nr:nucleotidyltransferase domain-containing protein [Ktedonobacterales bacterium]
MTLLEVIERIAPELEKNSHIHAMWLEGSWATGKNNEHSDIDVWLDVDDGTFEQCISAFRRRLNTVGEIDWEDTRGIYSREPMLMKQTFHPKGLPEEQVVELDLQEHSRQFVFSKSAHIIKVLFDKDGTIRWRP